MVLKPGSKPSNRIRIPRSKSSTVQYFTHLHSLAFKARGYTADVGPAAKTEGTCTKVPHWGCLASLFFCGLCIPHGVIWKEHFKGRGESKCFAKAHWHRRFTLLFHLSFTQSSHLSDVNMSVSQPSPKTNPTPSRPISSSSRPSSSSSCPSSYSNRPFSSSSRPFLSSSGPSASSSHPSSSSSCPSSSNRPSSSSSRPSSSSSCPS